MIVTDLSICSVIRTLLHVEDPWVRRSKIKACREIKVPSSAQVIWKCTFSIEV